MFNQYILTSINFDMLNIWLYFWNHLILIIFFSLHFFCVKFLKYKIDWKNIILKNYKNNENRRSIIETIKTIFYFDLQKNKRFFFLINK